MGGCGGLVTGLCASKGLIMRTAYLLLRQPINKDGSLGPGTWGIYSDGPQGITHVGNEMFTMYREVTGDTFHDAKSWLIRSLHVELMHEGSLSRAALLRTILDNLGELAKESSHV